MPCKTQSGSISYIWWYKDWKFSNRLSVSVAETPVKFQSYWKTIKTDLALSRFCDIEHHSDVIIKSPATRLFTQSHIQTQIKENIKTPRHRPLCGEFTGDQWIPRTKGIYMYSLKLCSQLITMLMYVLVLFVNILPQSSIYIVRWKRKLFATIMSPIWMQSYEDYNIKETWWEI